MKHIRIIHIKFVNFKSLRDKKITFLPVTDICGRNATGKTTVFDGFVWCLFGKDSTDRKQFSVKTLGANGKPVPKLPHEVEVRMNVDGEIVDVCRRLKERWTGQGTQSERFIGHEEERLYNGVPLSVAEFKDKISAIIDEELFKYVTNPKYFVSQKPETQRRLLFKMAGGVTDDDVAARGARFVRLLQDMKGKTTDEYRRETKANLDRVEKERASLPARIDERKRDALEPEDWDALESGLAKLGAELAIAEAATRDKARAITEASKRREDAAREVSELKKRMDERKREITGAAEDAYNAQVMEKVGISRDLENAAENVMRCRKTAESYERELRGEEEIRERLLEEYRSINEEKLIFNENDFACPACGRMLEADDIEGKKREMEERFNARKAARIKNNIESGKDVAQRIKERKEKIEKQRQLMQDEEQRIAALKERFAACNPVESAYEELIVEDAEYVRLSKELQEARRRLEALPEAVADDELQERKRGILLQLEEVKGRIAKRELIEANGRRIAELESRLRASGEEWARLKGVLEAIRDFDAERSRMLGESVNRLFRVVKFKLFDTQVNGEEKETCEATVGGVPYADVNAAGKIFAGLDIIIALQRHLEVDAPVFIDNAECITDYPEAIMQGLGQVIKLRATKDKELVVC